MNSNLINNQGRFIEAFDRELRAQINDYERRQAFEQESNMTVEQAVALPTLNSTSEWETDAPASYTLNTSTAR